MAASVTIWRGMAGFSSITGHADHLNCKARGISVIRPRAWFSKKYSCIPDALKLTQAPMGKIKKDDHSVFWPVCFTSSGSEPIEPIDPEEPRDNVQIDVQVNVQINKAPDKVEKKLFDQVLEKIDPALETDISHIDESSFGANDPTDEEPYDFQAEADHIADEAQLVLLFQIQINKNPYALLDLWFQFRTNGFPDEVEKLIPLMRPIRITRFTWLCWNYGSA